MPNLPVTDIVTEPVRIAFPLLFVPDYAKAKTSVQPTDKKYYQATLLLPPTLDLAPYVTAVKQAMLKKLGEEIRLSGDANPIRLCDDNNSFSKLKGWRFIRAKTLNAPAVVDAKRQPVVAQPGTNSSIIYSGCWVRAHINAYAWSNSGKKGVSFGLNAVQFVKDDERLDGRRSPDDLFEAIGGPVVANDDVKNLFG